MTPNFEFSFGKPAQDQPGRWIEGSVIGQKRGYRFTARLMRGQISTMLQCHPVSLKVGRPFCGEDFAAYLRMICRGRFTTTTRLLDLDFPDGLDPAIAGAIWDAMMVWVDPGDQNCPNLLRDMMSLGDQLEQVRKKELLGQAFAHFSEASRPAVADKEHPMPDEDRN